MIWKKDASPCQWWGLGPPQHTVLLPYTSLAPNRLICCSVVFAQCTQLSNPQSEYLTTVSISNKKGSPYSITERRVPELIPVLGSQPAGDVSHKPGSTLPLLSASPAAVTPATLKRAATNFAAW